MKITKIVLVAAATLGAAVALPTTAHADSPGVFLSPSGNIICSIGPDGDGTSSAMCEIARYHYTPPQAKPGNCFLSWGDRVSLDTGGAAVLRCHGDSAFGLQDQAATLPYGQSRKSGTITCTSRTNGMTCTDSSTGAYFRIARETLQVG